MKNTGHIYILISAFILPLNAQTFPQPELWLRDTAAQVINLTTDSVRSYEVPNSVAYTVYAVMRSDEPDSSQVLWYLTSGDSVVHGVLSDGVFSAGGVLRSSQSRDFSRYSIYHCRQSLHPDTAASLSFNLGPCDSLPSRIRFDELAYFPRSLTRNENAVFLTLLAIRHGISLTEVPYVTPLLDTLWHPVRDERFCHRITGIGKDSISGLNALESRSCENALVTLRSDNLKEGSYALTGDDDNSLYWNMSDTLYRLSSTWRIRTHVITAPLTLIVDASLTTKADTLRLALLDEAGWIRTVVQPDSIDAVGRTCFTLQPDTMTDYTFVTHNLPAARNASAAPTTSGILSANYVQEDGLLRVNYQLASGEPVTCLLYDSAGHLLATFAGSDSEAVTRLTLPAGVYHLRLMQAGRVVSTTKMIVYY